MDIRAIVCDVDGTLLTSKQVVDERTVAAIKKREFDSCLQFFTNQIAQNVDYINAFEFFYCQICENNCTNMG